MKRIRAVERDFIGAVPEQALLAMLEIEIDVDVTAFERQRLDYVLLNDRFCLLAVLGFFLFCLDDVFECGRGRQLILRGAPSRRDTAVG